MTTCPPGPEGKRVFSLRLASGYRYLFLALLALLVAYPILGSVEAARPWIDAIVYAVMLAGVLVTHSSRWQLVAVATLGVVTFGFLNLADAVDAAWVHVTSQLLGMSFFAYLAVQILRDILFGRRRVDSEIIYGALAVYLIIGVAFAFAYQLFGFVSSDAFNTTGLLDGDALAVFEGFLYFSFVTMTTLGFGDITPRTPQAGAFVTAQAIIGQMYLAVLVARLVSLQITDQLEYD